jgi:hypothetical protein
MSEANIWEIYVASFLQRLGINNYPVQHPRFSPPGAPPAPEMSQHTKQEITGSSCNQNAFTYPGAALRSQAGNQVHQSLRESRPAFADRY